LNPSNPLFDPDFWDAKVMRVRRERDGWNITLAYKICNSLLFFIPDEKNIYRIEPKAGDHLRLYGKGLGWPVRGLALNGYTLFWESEDDYQKRIEKYAS
jgi:hypothetical protein